jgi:glycogen operon protein
MTPVKVWLGYPYPLGATWLGNGVNFAIFSESAASVDLCLFDSPDARQENIRIPMTEHTDQVWHIFLPDVRPGTALRLPRFRALRSRTRVAL